MSSTTTPGRPPKAMSSRLLTMKFMQRAAASPTSPITPDEPSPKRRKVDSDSTPTKFNVNTLADQRAIEAAMASEEAKRQAALEKQAAEAGDTRWVLSFDEQRHANPSVTMRVVQTGFASLDSASSHLKYEDEDLEEKPAYVGRRSFGKFNKTLEKQQDGSFDDSSDDTSDSEDDNNENGEYNGEEFGINDDDDDPTSAMIKVERQEAVEKLKAQRKAQKKAAKAESVKMAKDRKKREVSLNGNNGGMTSLTGRQDPKCHKCGGPHLQAECNRKRHYQGVDDGPRRKARKSK